MTKIPVRVIRRQPSSDPMPVPNWFDDPTEVAPCPCGMPPDENCVLTEGDVPLMRWLHAECLSFLEYEMSDEELQEKEEYEEYQRLMNKEDDEDDE